MSSRLPLDEWLPLWEQNQMRDASYETAYNRTRRQPPQSEWIRREEGRTFHRTLIVSSVPSLN